MGTVKRGRPRKKIDLDDVRSLAAECNSQEEIAKVLGINIDTIHNRKDIHEAWEEGHAMMKLNLRHWQFESAKSGNVQMLIWLGKQYLGQKESVSMEMTDDDRKRIDEVISKVKE